MLQFSLWMLCTPQFVVPLSFKTPTGRTLDLLRSISPLIALSIFLTGAAVQPLRAQKPPPRQTKPASQDKTAPAATQDKVPTADKTAAQLKTPTAEQVAEGVIFSYGSRGVLDQIRRNGIERGRITRTNGEGRTEEATYERRFVRGADLSKDKIRVDQKMPNLEYSLIYGDGRLWGIINGASFTPRQDAVASFMSQYWHSIDTLLRYKENSFTLAYVDKVKLKGLDLYVIDVTDKEKRRTRYYISVKSLHILWLEYEEPPDAGGTPVRYTRRFFDYRPAQSTLVSYRSVLLADDKPVQETRISSVTFGGKLEESIFQNPEAQASSNQ